MKTKIGVVQMAIPASIPEAESKAETMVRQAAAAGAKIVCLPELYRTPYFCKREDISLFDLAEPLEGPSFRLFADLSRELGVSVIVPIFERRAPGLYHNTALVLDPKGYLGVYRKMHIPDDPSYYEKFYFTPGDLGFKSFMGSHGHFGVLICWDQWYPEAARLTALEGAETIFYPTAIGWLAQDKVQYGAAQLDAWVTMQRSHAIANGVYVAVANRVGVEEGTEFWGNSFVCGPDGTVIARMDDKTEGVLLADVDDSQVEFVRREWPFLRDRRTDAFAGMVQRFR